MSDSGPSADPLESAARAIIRSDLPEAERLLRSAVQDGGTRLTAAWANLSAVLAAQQRSADAEAEATRALSLWETVGGSGPTRTARPDEIEGLTMLLVQAGRAAEAVDLGRSAVRAAHTDPRTHAALGTALRAAGDAEQAAASMLRASAAWMDLGDPDQALLYAAAAGESAGPTAEVALAEARALAAKGQAPTARQRYEHAVAGDPSARSPAFEAELVRIEGRPDEALAKVDSVLQESPDHVEALGVRAQVLRDLGLLPDAIDTLNRVLAAGGGDRFRLFRATLKGTIGDGVGALADLDDLGPAMANSPLVHLIRAEFLLARERTEEALTHFDIALSLDPGNPLAKAERALALHALGRREEARSELEALLAEPPADQEVRDWLEGKPPQMVRPVRAEAMIIRGRLRLLDGDTDGARRDLAAGIEVTGPRPDATAFLAQAILSSGDPKGALAATEAVLPWFRATPDILRVKALALAQLERFDDALEAIEQVAELGLANAEIHHMWALILLALDRPEEALGHFPSAERLEGEAGVFIDHASTLEELGRIDEAIAVAAAAAERFPEDASVWALRGRLLSTTGEREALEAAVDAYTRSLRLDPDQPNVAAELGETFRRLERYDQALQWLDRALEGDPTSVFALGTKGQVLRAQRGDGEALGLLREAVRLAGEQPPQWLVQEIVPALFDLGTSEVEEALGHLDRFLATAPFDPWALRVRAEALRVLERPAEGLESVDAALRAAGEAPQEAESALGTKAHLLVDLSQPREALATADTALERAGGEGQENTFALSARIRALISLDRHQEALTDVDRYLELEGGDDPWGLMTKAIILGDWREFEAALRLLERVEPTDPFRQALVGYCRNRLGDHRGGAEALRAAVEAQDRVWWWWAELGEALWRAEDHEEARQAFRVLLEAASSSSATDANLLINGAWAALRLGDDVSAVGHARRAVALEADTPAHRLILATMLLRTGRGLAAQEEIEAAETMAAERPDPRRGAAILEEAISDLEWLLQEGVLEGQRAEAESALETLRVQARRLRERAPAPAV